MRLRAVRRAAPEPLPPLVRVAVLVDELALLQHEQLVEGQAQLQREAAGHLRAVARSLLAAEPGRLEEGARYAVEGEAHGGRGRDAPEDAVHLAFFETADEEADDRVGKEAGLGDQHTGPHLRHEGGQNEWQNEEGGQNEWQNEEGAAAAVHARGVGVGTKGDSFAARLFRHLMGGKNGIKAAAPVQGLRRP